ncbi:benenodin family lasso peptide [Pseudoxanthomonas sp. X-1]|nr:benenodin family lasso peptide [Pseudoxanthomonas sp. X-1]TMN24204.1 benenodin family lasso peptide [Pseudoxanthomonas sp. X-1]UAY75168.1 benenodin family lasso peptide [Pseudoxanthomonas sp. X-1]
MKTSKNHASPEAKKQDVIVLGAVSTETKGNLSKDETVGGIRPAGISDE